MSEGLVLKDALHEGVIRQRGQGVLGLIFLKVRQRLQLPAT